MILLGGRVVCVNDCVAGTILFAGCCILSKGC